VVHSEDEGGRGKSDNPKTIKKRADFENEVQETKGTSNQFAKALGEFLSIAESDHSEEEEKKEGPGPLGKFGGGSGDSVGQSSASDSPG